MQDRMTMKSRGFGFVTMVEASDAQKAIEQFNGKQIEGRALTVNEARPVKSVAAAAVVTRAAAAVAASAPTAAAAVVVAVPAATAIAAAAAVAATIAAKHPL